MRTVAFSRDGSRLATGDDTGTLCLWTVSDASETARTAAHTGPVRVLLFAREGELLVSGGDDGSVIRWNAETLEPHREQSQRRGVAFSLSPSLLSGAHTGWTDTGDR